MKEDESQAYICSWCLQNKLIPVAVPNGVNLGAFMKMLRSFGVGDKEMKAINAKQMIMLKKEGLHTGFPDMFVVGNKAGSGAILFVENKVKGGKPSDLQLACHQWLRNLGFCVEVSESSVDAIKKIRSFFGAYPQYLNHSYIEARREIITEAKRNIKLAASTEKEKSANRK